MIIIKVSGIASGNKLIKTIRYPHMWRYRWFQWHQVCLLNCNLIRWCIIETSSGLPRKSSAIFGKFQKFSENVQERSSGLRDNFGKSSESGRKSSENHQKRRYQYVYIIKRTLHVSSKIWILCYSWQEQYLTRSLRSLVRYCSCHSNIKFLSSRHRIISSIYNNDCLLKFTFPTIVSCSITEGLSTFLLHSEIYYSVPNEKKMISLRIRFRENNDFSIKRRPAEKKKPPFFIPRAD